MQVRSAQSLTLLSEALKLSLLLSKTPDPALNDEAVALIQSTEAEKLNPQIAARMVPPLGRWRRLVEPYADGMKAELKRILDTPGLSKDVFEQVSKSLA